jgi:hypothetical protein
MGVQILNKDVSVISNVIGKLKASIGNILGKTGWSGGGAASQGPLAGTPPATNNTSVPFGNTNWSGLANLFSTTASSNADFLTGSTSYYIVGQGFGFSIPPTATINGIIVTLESKIDAGFLRDYFIKIVKNNIITGDNKSTGTQVNIGSFASRTYGSSTDLWGTTWTAADINSSNFGLAYSVEYLSFSKSIEVGSVRNLRITVHYTT